MKCFDSDSKCFLFHLHMKIPETIQLVLPFFLLALQSLCIIESSLSQGCRGVCTKLYAIYLLNLFKENCILSVSQDSYSIYIAGYTFYFECIPSAFFTINTTGHNHLDFILTLEKSFFLVYRRILWVNPLTWIFNYISYIDNINLLKYFFNYKCNVIT